METLSRTGRRGALMTLALGLAACNTPGFEFIGTDPRLVAVGGAEFHIYHNDYKAEALAQTNDWRRPSVDPRAGVAIERATGCKVIPGTLVGEFGVAQAEIQCPGVAPRPPKPPPKTQYACVSYRDVSRHETFYTRDLYCREV